jgi:hypothetical protein
MSFSRNTQAPSPAPLNVATDALTCPEQTSDTPGNYHCSGSRAALFSRFPPLPPTRFEARSPLPLISHLSSLISHLSSLISHLSSPLTPHPPPRCRIDPSYLSTTVVTSCMMRTGGGDDGGGPGGAGRDVRNLVVFEGFLKIAKYVCDSAFPSMPV